MNQKKIIKSIALFEVAIGVITLAGLLLSLLLSIFFKSLNVFIFVLFSSITSVCIGAGLLLFKQWARQALIIFSFYIIITKILLFSGLLVFNGEILTLLPSGLKNSFSLCYHAFILLFLSKPVVKKLFSGKGLT